MKEILAFLVVIMIIFIIMIYFIVHTITNLKPREYITTPRFTNVSKPAIIETRKATEREL